MPRRYARTYRRRYPRKKWSPVFTSYVTALEPTAGWSYQTLAANSYVQGGHAPISTMIKVKNFKIVVDVASQGETQTASHSPSITFAILFVPQGYTVASDILAKHPEWIMAWRAIDIYTTNVVTVTSRLARNLNSGDEIIAFFSRNYLGQNPPLVNILMQTTFCTCSN